MKVISFTIIFFTCIIINIACENLFDYSPYVIHFSKENRDVNSKNIVKLGDGQNNDTITIAFTGDTHNYFDEMEKFVASVNKNSSIDFVIHVGDIADFGLPKQYLWGNSILLKLRMPYFVTIGNHDLVGNGSNAYKEMFGAFDFSFIYGNVKFVFINTNSLEFKNNGNVPDIQWLNEQLKPSNNFSNAVVVFHVPPEDDGFDARLVEPFYQTISLYDNVLFTVHGHLHNYEIYNPFDGTVTYINVYGVEYNKYNVIKIFNSNYYVETFEF